MQGRGGRKGGGIDGKGSEGQGWDDTGLEWEQRVRAGDEGSGVRADGEGKGRGQNGDEPYFSNQIPESKHFSKNLHI